MSEQLPAEHTPEQNTEKKSGNLVAWLSMLLNLLLAASIALVLYWVWPQWSGLQQRQQQLTEQQQLSQSAAQQQQQEFSQSLEQQLAEPAIYEAANKAQLTKLLTEQTQASSELAQIEESWFEAQEALEQQSQHFWQQNQ